METQEESKNIPLKDKIALLLSVNSLLVSFAAFAVSFITLYYTTVRQVDDVRVEVRWIPTLWIDKQLKNITVQQLPKDMFTFINLGNKTAGISSIKFFLIQPDDEGNIRNCDEASGNFETDPEVLDADPVVIKAGEIGVPSHVGFARSEFKTKLERPSTIAGEATVRLCAAFDVSTPNNDVLPPISREINTLKIKVNSSGNAGEAALPLDRQIILVQKRSTIFNLSN